MHRSFSARRVLVSSFFFGSLLSLAILPRPAAGDDAPGTLDGKPLPADAVVLRPALLNDPVIGKDAYSVLVPSGWKMQGDVTWLPGAPTAVFDISVSNPALKAAWREFPRTLYVSQGRGAVGSLTPTGLEIRPLPASAEEYVLKVLAPQYVAEVASAKDVKVVSQMDLPEVAKASTAGDPLHRPATSTRIRITYTAAGEAVERDFVVTIVMPNPQPVNPNYRGPAIATPIMWIAQVTTYRAPAGKLDALLPTMVNIESSLKVQLPWYNAEVQVAANYVQHQAQIDNQILGDQAGAIAARARIFHQMATAASDQVSQQIQQNFAAQQTAKAQEQTQFMHYIQGTSAYTNPNDGSTLVLPSNYKFQYVSNNGDVIQTDDATFQPPVDPKTSWQQMQKAN